MAQSVSCIDLLKAIEAEDSSDESGSITPVEIETVNTAKYKTYMTLVSSQVHRSVYALHDISKMLTQPIEDYYRTTHTLEMSLDKELKKAFEEMQPWIDGKKSLSMVEQMKFVSDRWNVPLSTAKYTGIPVFWGRIVKALPFFQPTAEEMKVLPFLHTILVQKSPLEKTEKGYALNCQLTFQFDKNDIIDEGAVIKLNYIYSKSLPIGQIVEYSVALIKNTAWHTKIAPTQTGKYFNFFSAFETTEKEKQFVFFYTLANYALPNAMRWFDDSVLQKKSMNNLYWEKSKEYDYKSNNVVEDAASLQCIQQ
ncbi:hypothetical protein EIN_025460 [Entamoeba invadens IP1]|uniref:hypothetical protein n=1 Tax=Entamoeba invadens IP1 TaxID=370355 RepID=UPI0002C3E200|nr:hypothetical protein EIN_025460 [Entamoeba invadens IP1]ELP90727.1 hypothetical protein EIN_025460 [Entamoeba invadens IP1]|eukprot:XP_004257498.1 hypothetical protein EIN_025460 [Entamoeba invadens IP1]